MKIMILEYITAGGLCNETLPPSLLREGLLMRDALISDLKEIKDIEISTTYDVRLPEPLYVNNSICINKNSDINAIWSSLIYNCDATLIIAPETNAVLNELTKMLERTGIKNLGCPSNAVFIASDKIQTFNIFKKFNILTVPTYLISEFLILPMPKSGGIFKSGYVIKPRDGAGCQETLYFNEYLEFKTWININVSEDMQSKYIIQPYITGFSGSISMLCKKGKAWVLGCNQQFIEIDSNKFKQKPFQFKGCLVNGLIAHHKELSELALKITQAIPDLNGYIGVDVILNHEDIYVVEINPRITTSYIGLKESLNYNPAQILLELAYNPLFSFPENLNRTMVEVRIDEY